jgi:hypothetical protein
MENKDNKPAPKADARPLVPKPRPQKKKKTVPLNHAPETRLALDQPVSRLDDTRRMTDQGYNGPPSAYSVNDGPQAFPPVVFNHMNAPGNQRGDVPFGPRMGIGEPELFSDRNPYFAQSIAKNYRNGKGSQTR